MEIAALLEPVSAQPPCGPDLEYDPLQQELERAVQGKPEQVIGDHTIPATPPDWNDVRERAVAQLSRSKDLRVAVWLTRALVNLEHLAGLASGLRLIEGLLERYWEPLHPLPDPDDQDLTIRLNTLAALASADALLGDVRGALLIRASSHGKISVRDAEVALGRLPAPAAGAMSLAQIEAALAAAPESPHIVESLRTALHSCQAINALLAEKAGTHLAPDLKPLLSALQGLLTLVPAEQEAIIADEVATPEQTDEAARPSSPLGVDIRSREDALRMLDRVCDYLIKHEPSNPAPLLIRRAQRLMNMDFVELIQELAPDGLTQIKHLAGLDK